MPTSSPEHCNTAAPPPFMETNMSRILITGKNGQVGYELERSLQGLGEIIALDRSQMDLADRKRQSRAVFTRAVPASMI